MAAGEIMVCRASARSDKRERLVRPTARSTVTLVQGSAAGDAACVVLESVCVVVKLCRVVVVMLGLGRARLMCHDRFLVSSPQTAP